MLPPVDPTVLSANPKFEVLYRDLCTNKLHSDGTTIPDPKTLKERVAFDTELHNTRFEAAKRDLVKTGLKDLAYRADALPDELRELVAITVAMLEGDVPAEDRDVVQDYLDDFVRNASPISTALSNSLTQKTADLSSLVFPNDAVPPSSLGPSLTKFKTAIATFQSNTATLRLNLTSTTTTLLTTQLSLLQSLISTLSQSLHGAHARATRAHAEHLSLVAQGMARKLRLQQLQLLSQLYAGDVAKVLEERSGVLRVEERRLKREVAEREEVLGRYREVRGMEGLRGEYGEVVREVARVRGEVRRLEGNEV